MSQIEWELKQRDFGFSIVSLQTLESEAAMDAIDQLKSQRVDGMIMLLPFSMLDLGRLITLCQGVHFVVIDTDTKNKALSLSIDQSTGSQKATQHLLDLGHKMICEISGPLNWYDAQQRHQACQNSLSKAGLELLAHKQGNWSAASGYKACKEFLAQRLEFSALIVGNDQMALGAISALAEKNLQVPHDVSVIGFDDIPEAAFFNPPLTTIHQDFETLARQSVDLVLADIKKPLGLKQHLLNPSLIIRKSTARPRLLDS